MPRNLVLVALTIIAVLLATACSPSQFIVPTGLAQTQTAAPRQAVSLVILPSITSPSTKTALAPANTPTEPATATPLGEQTGKVVRILDGDTIDVEIDGQVFRVRYIGVNTPEKDQPCFAEATAANVALVSNRIVTLVKDVSGTDRFNRLLRYVYVGDVFVNADLVKQGYAEAVEYPPDTSKSGYLEGLEAEARAAERGCHPTGVFGGADGVALPTATAATQALSTPTALSPTTTAVVPTQLPAQNCDSAYPTVCIPPPPPDLDCGQIPYRRFQVLPPDPHRFDADGDGIGCER